MCNNPRLAPGLTAIPAHLPYRLAAPTLPAKGGRHG